MPLKTTQTLCILILTTPCCINTSQIMSYTKKKSLLLLDKKQFAQRIQAIASSVNKKVFQIDAETETFVRSAKNIFSIALGRTPIPAYLLITKYSGFLKFHNKISLQTYNDYLSLMKPENKPNKLNCFGKLVKLFIDEAGKEYLYTFDEKGNTPLDCAFQLENYKAACYILEKTPDVISWAPLKKTTPFQKIVSQENIYQKGKFLIQQGATILEQDFEPTEKTIDKKGLLKLKNWYYKTWLVECPTKNRSAYVDLIIHTE